jgi:hypothetical protein
VPLARVEKSCPGLEEEEDLNCKPPRAEKKARNEMFNPS